MTDTNIWDQRFFALCDFLATWSEEQGRKVGAVIVGPSHEIRSTGYNGTPRGVDSTNASRRQRENNEKYYWFEHAERNAIYNAARVGTSLQGCAIYTSMFPCADCARAIIQSGLVEVRTKAAPSGDPIFSRSFEVAQEMLREAGVTVEVA